MIKRSWFLIAALGLLANLAGVTPSHANSVTYTSASVAVQDVPFSVSLTLPKFNPSMGTLTGVAITVNATIVGDVQIFNNSAGNLPFTNAFTSIPVEATGPAGAVASTTAVANLASGIANGPFQVTSFPGTLATATGSASPLSFAPYVGSGNFSATLSSTASNASSGGTGGGGKLFFGGTAQAGGSISVTYTFTPNPVPEPASMSLLGIGMAGLVAFRRYFQRSARVSP